MEPSKFSIHINKLLNKKHYSLAEMIFDRLNVHTLDRQSCNAMMRCFGFLSKRERMQQLLQLMKDSEDTKPNVKTYTTLIQFLGKHDTSQMEKATFHI
jgi:hypothetical protein